MATATRTPTRAAKPTATRTKTPDPSTLDFLRAPSSTSTGRLVTLASAGAVYFARYRDFGLAVTYRPSASTRTGGACCGRSCGVPGRPVPGAARRWPPCIRPRLSPEDRHPRRAGAG